jgi:hypothetical protein
MNNHLTAFVTTGPAANRAQAVHAIGQNASTYVHQHGVGALWAVVVLVAAIYLLAVAGKKAVTRSK